MQLNQFKCVPACKTCRELNLCQKALAVRADEDVRMRAYNPVVEQIKLPCGCYDLELSIVTVFGSHIDRVLCQDHGWQTLSRNRKKTMQAEARKKIRATETLVVNMDLFDEPPF